MSLREHLDTAAGGPKAQHGVSKQQAPGHPQGFQPGYHLKEGELEFVVRTDEKQEPELRAMCEAEGFDPDRWHVVGDVEMRKWNQHYEHPDLFCYYWKVKFRPVGHGNHVDIDALCESVTKRRSRKAPTPAGSSTWVLTPGDWQAGSNHGGGPEQLVERIEQLVAQIPEEWARLRRISDPDRIVVAFMGDMVENCGQGTNSKQVFDMQLNDRDQRKIVRWGIDLVLETCARLAPVHAIAVPGNHGENRQNGRAFTDNQDNVDVAVVEDVQFAYSKNLNGRYDHVTFQYPHREDLAVTWEDPNSGVVVCFAHGHQWKGSAANPISKAYSWWLGNMANGQRPGFATLLVTAHFHHFRHVQMGSRQVIQVPALCGRQDWFTNYSGVDSPPGTCSFVLAAGERGGMIDHVRVLDGRIDADIEAMAQL